MKRQEKKKPTTTKRKSFTVAHLAINKSFFFDILYVSINSLRIACACQWDVWCFFLFFFALCLSSVFISSFCIGEGGFYAYVDRCIIQFDLTAYHPWHSISSLFIWYSSLQTISSSDECVCTCEYVCISIFAQLPVLVQFVIVEEITIFEWLFFSRIILFVLSSHSLRISFRLQAYNEPLFNFQLYKTDKKKYTNKNNMDFS